MKYKGNQAKLTQPQKYMFSCAEYIISKISMINFFYVNPLFMCNVYLNGTV